MALRELYLYSVIVFFCLYFLNISGERVYDIHLEDKPIDRWTEVATDYAWNIQQFESILTEIYPLGFLRRLDKYFESLQNILIPSNYLEELQGIQKSTNVSMGLLVIANMLYDLTAQCTSIVAQGTDGKIWHARNMDYDLTEHLKNSTIIVNFKRNNKTIYRGLTFAGYIGMLTAEKNGIFTISLNQNNTRFAGFRGFRTRSLKMASFAIRDSLETHNSYEEVVSYFTDVELIAPGYYIIGGALPGQGAVISRNRSHAVDVWTLSSVDERWFLVATNFDHWEYPIDRRRQKAIDTLQKIGQNDLNSTNLLQLLSTAPVYNSISVYSIVMSAKDDNVWNYRIWKN